MNLRLLLALMLLPLLGRSEVLPFISISPQSTNVAPGSNVVFSVTSTNATAYQWRFSGTNIAWGTASSLVITNAQTNHTGYYVVLAKNNVGWTPSALAFLSVVGSNGIVPFYNTNIPLAQATYQYGLCEWTGNGAPITNAQAQLFAGPNLEELKPVGTTRSVNNGYFGNDLLTRLIPTVAPGQTAYCRVDISFTLPPGCVATSWIQRSAILPLRASGNGFSNEIPSGLRFPYFLEWPDTAGIYALDEIGVPGETLTVRGSYYTYGYHTQLQWRKDGQV